MTSNRQLLAAAVAVDISVPAVVLGDQEAVEKYRNFSPQQIAAMPEDKRSSELPIMYTLAARKAFSAGVDLVFGMELNKLMYPGLHDFSLAVRQFQSDLGDAPTGKLTVWQIHQLERRAELQGLSKFFPGSVRELHRRGLCERPGHRENRRRKNRLADKSFKHQMFQSHESV